MAIIRSGTDGSTEADVIDGHLQVSVEHTPPGFVPVQFRAEGFTASTTEALLTLTPMRDYAAGAPGTSHGVTAGKRLKLLRMSLVVRNVGAAGQGAVCSLRINPAGAAVIGSPATAVVAAGTSLAIANIAAFGETNVEGEYDLNGSAQLAVSQIGPALAGNTLILHGYEYIV